MNIKWERVPIFKSCKNAKEFSLSGFCTFFEGVIILKQDENSSPNVLINVGLEPSLREFQREHRAFRELFLGFFLTKVIQTLGDF